MNAFTLACFIVEILDLRTGNLLAANTSTCLVVKNLLVFAGGTVNAFTFACFIVEILDLRTGNLLATHTPT